MAQPKKVTRKAPAKRKSNTGGLKQSNLNFLSWKVLVPALILFAAVGGYYVSQSFAASWSSIHRRVFSENELVLYPHSISGINSGVSLSKGKTYRFCVRGRSSSNSRTDVTLSFATQSPTYRSDIAASKKSYGKSSELHCSNTFYASKNHRVTTQVFVPKNNNTLYIDVASIDVAR